MNHLIVNESIVISDGKNNTAIPIRSLEKFRFRYDFDMKNQTGQGIKKMVPGEIIGTENNGRGSEGIGAGDEPEEDIYEAEVTYEDLAAILFKELKLPDLEEKKRPLIAHDCPEFNDIRKKGCMANVDKKRTLLQSIKRQAFAQMKRTTAAADRLPHFQACSFALLANSSTALSANERLIIVRGPPTQPPSQAIHSINPISPCPAYCSKVLRQLVIPSIRYTGGPFSPIKF